MSMPEAPIHKDARPVFPQHQVRMPRQSFMVQPISESSLPQATSHNHLRLRVLRLDSRHVGMSLLCGESVHITSMPPSISLPPQGSIRFASCLQHISFVSFPYFMTRLFPADSIRRLPRYLSTNNRPISFKATKRYRCDSAGTRTQL